jgi:hypothetical protein
MPLLISKLLSFRQKIILLLPLMVLCSFGSLHSAITGGVTGNKVLFCLIGLAGLQILICKKNEEQ